MRTNDDGTVQTQSSLEVIVEASTKALEEPWLEHVDKIKQPTLLVNAPGPYGPPDAPPLFSKEQATQTVDMLANGHYLRVPGNHMTMLFGPNATATVEAITSFV